MSQGLFNVNCDADVAMRASRELLLVRQVDLGGWNVRGARTLWRAPEVVGTERDLLQVVLLGVLREVTD